MSTLHCQNFCLLAWACLLILPPAARSEIFEVNDPLAAGIGGYNVYRIPAFTVAADGSLLLFAEGRPSGSDPGVAGDIDMVFARSTDSGATWSPVAVRHQTAGFDYSDPRVVVDRTNGQVHLLYTQWPTLSGQTSVPVGLGDNSSVTMYQSSADNGVSWSDPVNLNAQVKDPSWASLNTGPGVGIQLQWQDGAPHRNGRLLIPGHRRPDAYRGVAIYSDDGGVTWQSGSGVTPHFADESEVIELTNGHLLWDARRGSAGRNRSISRDGGDTWTDASEGDIPIAAVDSGIIRYSAQRAGDDRDRILYAAPLGNPAGTGNGRTNIGIWTSYDEGQTFINPVQIQSGSAAYSAIDRLADGSIGLVYEVSHHTIRFVRFDLQELEHHTLPAELTHYDSFSNVVDRRRGGVGWSGSWTGTAEFTGEVATAFGDSSIPFPALGGSSLGGRVDLLAGQANEITRNLVAPVSLGQDQTTYLSLVISGALDSTAPGEAAESLTISLRDNTSTSRMSFGISNSQQFFVESLGIVQESPDETFERGETFLLVAKIVSQSTAAGGGDQIFLRAFQSGVDPLPASDESLDWTVVGSVGQDSTAVLRSIAIASGANATWSIDDLRIGTSLAAVTGMLGDSTVPNGLDGDVNQDGVISGDGTGPPEHDDVSAFLLGWQATTLGLPPLERIRLGDLNLDGQTNLRDAFVLHRALESQGAGFPFSLLQTNQVPEPATASLVATVLVLYKLWQQSLFAAQTSSG